MNSLKNKMYQTYNQEAMMIFKRNHKNLKLLKIQK